MSLNWCVATQKQVADPFWMDRGQLVKKVNNISYTSDIEHVLYFEINNLFRKACTRLMQALAQISKTTVPSAYT